MLTDEQLVRAMAGGDQAAFEAFVQRYHGPMLRYLERQLQDPRRAEDFVQELFLRLIVQLREGRVPEQVRPWMYRVGLNLCRDYWKSSGYKAARQMDGELIEQTDPKGSVVEIYERQETRKEMLATLERLPEVQRDIIIMRFYEELKLHEIAAALEIPLSSIKTHLYNGLKKLKLKYAERGSNKPNKEGDPYARADR